MDTIYKQPEKNMKKLVSTILIIATVVSIGAGVFLYKPQNAKAFLGVGDINFDVGRFLKENILDGIVKPVARHMMVRLQQEIARWAQGGFSDENTPFAMIDWKQELKNIANVASGRMVSEFGLTPLCAPIKISLGTMMGFNQSNGAPPYTIYAACTLDKVVDNVEDFYENPSIGTYGWDTWTALTSPNNNFLGSALMALTRQQEIKSEEKEAQEKEIEAGQGVKNETVCNETDKERCLSNCPDETLCKSDCNKKWIDCMADLDKNAEDCNAKQITCEANCDCERKCEISSTGVCLKETTKKLGSEIKASIDSVIGSDMQWLISADEITEMLDLVFSGLFNKLINGANGLMTKAFYSNGGTTKNFDYAYYKDFKKNLTPEDLKKVKTDILKNILDSVKSISTAGYTCENDEQFVGDVYNEVNTEILDQEAQHLYTSTEGVDLKPDFIVLDSQIAVNNGIARYGVTWDDIPFSKYPEKCADIADAPCKSIKTGLPYELKIENANPECGIGCHEQINIYRNQGMGDVEAINQAVTDGKCSSYAVGNTCLQAGYLIDRTKTRCDSCIKDYENKECALKETEAERDQCMEMACGNYKDISSSITSAYDFYNNHCKKRETQYNCEVCLKEYFVPAEYCEQINDYISRAYVKYPAIVYTDTWYGPLVKFDTEQTGCISQNDTQGYIPTGLTCRIMPDFKFPNGGTCEQYCINTTADEFKDTTDNKPTDLDCVGPSMGSSIGFPDWGGVWWANGKHPGLIWGYYMSVKKIKCCGALTGHDPERYELCRGAAIMENPAVCTYALPVDQEPWCYCNNGERPLGFTRTGLPRDGGMGGDCGDFSFTSPNQTVRGYSNNDTTGDVFYIATGSCNESKENCEDTTGEDTDESTNISCTDTYTTDATGPSGVICEWELDGGMLNETCDLSGKTGTIHAGVYHNDNFDTGSNGWHICTQCNSGDSGYPYYGTNYDQCNNKAQ